MLEDIVRRGDGRVIARGIEICHGWWRRRLLDAILLYFAMFCLFSVVNVIVIYGYIHCWNSTRKGSVMGFAFVPQL